MNIDRLLMAAVFETLRGVYLDLASCLSYWKVLEACDFDGSSPCLENLECDIERLTLRAANWGPK